MSKENKTEDAILLCKAKNNLELDTILEALKENDIDHSYERKGTNIGPYFESSDEKSFIEVYVHKSDAEKAKEIVEPIIGTLG